jgi:hypothetical protein
MGQFLSTTKLLNLREGINSLIVSGQCLRIDEMQAMGRTPLLWWDNPYKLKLQRSTYKIQSVANALHS